MLNPLSLPGHKCARCNKDYGSRVFDEEDKDEMFDFPHVLWVGGGGQFCVFSKTFRKDITQFLDSLMME